MSASRNIRIDLVANQAGSAADVKPAPAPARIGGAPVAANAAGPTATEDGRVTTSALAAGLAVAGLFCRAAAAFLLYLWRLVRRAVSALCALVQRTGSLSRLSAAAAALSVAMVMLLQSQFGVTPPPPAAKPTLPQQSRAAAPAAVGAGVAAAKPTDVGLHANQDALVARMTAGTLAALRNRPLQMNQPPQPVASAAGEGSALFRMVRSAAAQGQSEAYIDKLVNAAYRRQDVSVPASLIRADGQVDTATILALLVGN